MSQPEEKIPWPRQRVTTWGEFQHAIEPYLDGNWLFRGVTSVRHVLVPSVGRTRDGNGYSLDLERALFRQFKREALPLLPARPQTDWEWLALAQHHGVPTRLLDWSESPSVSLFFAAWGNDDEDAGMYIVPRPDEVPEDGDPFLIESVSFFYPGYVTPRLVSQRGLFTVHPKPQEPYLAKEMRQIVIGKESKPDLRRKLDASGVHHAMIMADLDGLSRRLVAAHAYRRLPSTSIEPIRDASEPAKRSISGSISAIAPERRVPRGKINPRDPQKGQWGGKHTTNGWTVTATVKQIDTDWYSIILTVSSQDTSKRLEGFVTFHLHDTFVEPVRQIEANNGEAVLELKAYGAFTVGVVIEKDGTTLELDLADLAEAPDRFREQ